MIKINPIETTNKGYRYSLSKKIKIGSLVKLFSQTFLIESKKDGVHIGTSRYTGVKASNKSGSALKGEHNLIFISSDEVWRAPIGKRGEFKA